MRPKLTEAMGKTTQMRHAYTQLNLPSPVFESAENDVRDSKPGANRRANRLDPRDRALHDWYRFVLSFPPHLVRDYIKNFGLAAGNTVCDPFCGTGTTLVESRLQGMNAIGVEANPFAQFASSVKLDWGIDPTSLLDMANAIASKTLRVLESQGIDDNQPFPGSIDSLVLRTLDSEPARLLLADSISPLPLHKTLVLLDCAREHSGARCYRHMLLALANALVFTISNLHFGPEVGVRDPKDDVPVVTSWLAEVKKIASDLGTVAGRQYLEGTVYLADARNISSVLPPGSVDAVITSPPYPNEKDYTRTTRLESVILGFIRSKSELRGFKKTLVRSNTRSVYKEDDDDRFIAEHAEIQRIADAIERRRIELGKDSGFERMYHKVTKLYFGGMARHLSDLRGVLRPGARLAYVVGDQASYLRVMIRTGQLLAEIAQALGYELIRIDLFRTRLATATREQLREEVVVLRWPGQKG